METRKLISFGSSSYVISLPKNWVSQNQLEKGDSLYIEEKPNELIITSGDSEKEKRVKEKQIDCAGKPIEKIRCELFASYLNNYNIIEIRQLDEEKFPKVKEMLHNLAGLEILEQTSDKIIAKDLINLKEVSIKALMRRIDIIIRSMMDDAVTIDQKNNVKSLYDRDEDINRLTFLVRRMITAALEDQKISRMFESEPKDIILDWEVALRLEKVGDNLKRISKCISKLKAEDRKFPDITDIFGKLKLRYLSIMKAYYGRDIAIASDVETTKGQIYDKCDELLQNGMSANKQFVVLVENFKIMNARIADIAKAVVLNCV
jgi:phosphate uptake regulator